ncbi:MAG: hypothetical protein KDD61_10165 [Bdellovibrionales bacterium]|nr:hypothetical protein [Bdellovibrionales bacterium]
MAMKKEKLNNLFMEINSHASWTEQDQLLLQHKTAHSKGKVSNLNHETSEEWSVYTAYEVISCYKLFAKRLEKAAKGLSVQVKKILKPKAIEKMTSRECDALASEIEKLLFAQKIKPQTDDIEVNLKLVVKYLRINRSLAIGFDSVNAGADSKKDGYSLILNRAIAALLKTGYFTTKSPRKANSKDWTALTKVLFLPSTQGLVDPVDSSGVPLSHRMFTGLGENPIRIDQLLADPEYFERIRSRILERWKAHDKVKEDS